MCSILLINPALAASTTLLGMYNKHFGSGDPSQRGKANNILAQLKGKYPYLNLHNINSGKYFSFMFVRHPFDRVLSAYRDRVLSGIITFDFIAKNG